LISLKPEKFHTYKKEDEDVIDGTADCSLESHDLAYDLRITVDNISTNCQRDTLSWSAMQSCLQKPGNIDSERRVKVICLWHW